MTKDGSSSRPLGFVFIWQSGNYGSDDCVQLTRMPSHRDTARNGRSARSVRIDRKAGISAAPAKVAAKLTNDS